MPEGSQGLIRILSLAAVLFVFWLLLSGHFTPFLVISGAVSALFIAWLGSVLGYADEEGIPIELVPRGFLYWPWLVKEAARSALEVAAIVVNPALPISPQLIRVKTSQKTAVGMTIYANSITLTPGTITVEVNRHDKELLVHALTGAGADGLAEGEMDRRVTIMEGRR
jgi:multicomponent Na+:H+ antiporter subunit E